MTANNARKIPTGWAKCTQEFRIHTVVHRTSTGLYDVSVHVNEGSKAIDLFSNEPISSRQHVIFRRLETREEAFRVAQFARDHLLAMVTKQVDEWRDAAN